MGKALKRMLPSKAISEGLKSVECKHGIGGKNSPIPYIPKQVPIQFELTLPSGSEMRMSRWASRTSEHFLIHVRGAIHAIKEMGLITKLKDAMDAVETTTLDLDITKTAYKHEMKNGEGYDTLQQAA